MVGLLVPLSAAFARQGRLALTAPIATRDDALSALDQACRRVIDGRRAARVLAAWTRRFELGEAEILTLWWLSSTAGGVDQTTLAQQLALSPAQISATVERLRARGQIVQDVSRGDRRRHVWQLSAEGRRLLDDALTLPRAVGRQAPAQPPSALPPESTQEAAA